MDRATLGQNIGAVDISKISALSILGRGSGIPSSLLLDSLTKTGENANCVSALRLLGRVLLVLGGILVCLL
jgi:hypothetical protein